MYECIILFYVIQCRIPSHTEIVLPIIREASGSYYAVHYVSHQIIDYFPILTFALS